MINKKTFLLFISFILIIFIFTGSAYSQSTKTVTKSGTGHEDLIIQKGDQQSAGLNQEGERQRAFIFQAGVGQAANVNQSGGSNLAFIYQMLNVKRDSTQIARLTQTGFNNFLFVNQSELNRASFSQNGTGNTIFYHQKSDSLEGQPSKINIKQTGSGNSATVIQN